MRLDALTEHECSADEIRQLIREKLRPHFSEFASCRSRRELHAHPAYPALEPVVHRVLGSPEVGHFGPPDLPAKPRYRFLAWNLERGTQLEGQVEAFLSHPYLKTCDVCLLTEADVGMARSGNRDVAQTLARELKFHYAFAPCYLNLAKGSGVEHLVDGDNELGLHGNAILSRYPIRHVRSIPLANGIDKMSGREKRIGCQVAVSAEIVFPNLSLSAVSIHLDANSSQAHRRQQMQTVLDALPDTGPTILGGDWNTTTFNSSTAFRAIMGYWLRVLMGPSYVIRNHYLHPYRLFERSLFRMIEQHGFDFRNANRLGEYTVYYELNNERTYHGLAEWVPRWCFPFIAWALRHNDGRCPLKLDWFAVRSLSVQNPQVIHDLREGREVPLSDHDAIGIEVVVP